MQEANIDISSDDIHDDTPSVTNDSTEWKERSESTNRAGEIEHYYLTPIFPNSQ